MLSRIARALPLAALLIATGAGCRHATEEAASSTTSAPPGEVWLSREQVQGARITISPLEVKELGSAVSTSGKVTFDDLKVTRIFSPVTGRVIKILAMPGQRVKRGTPLALIESPDVGSAFSDLGKAQADLVAAEREYKRQQELYAAHAGAQKDFEQAQDAFRRAKAELQRAQQKARMLRDGATDQISQEYTLRTPIDGEVIARSINPGTEVQGMYSGGTPLELFTIGELDEVWVQADVFEQDLAQVKIGARAMVKVVAYPDRVFEGHIDYVSGSLDATTHTAKVRCDIKNPDRLLKPEMFATVSLVVADRKAPALLRTALLRLGDTYVVFVQTRSTPDGRLIFERRPVAVNEDEGGDYVPVTHGLVVGDKVVTAGAVLLSGML